MLRLLVLVPLSILAATALAEECPQLPSLPELSAADKARHESWQSVAQPYSIVHTSGGYDHAPFGVGHLRVENESDYFYDWQRAVVMPLWTAPDGGYYGWIRGGQVYSSETGESFPLTGIGMVETGYEHQTFIVWEVREEGWLKVSLKPGENGDAWINKCHLGLGPAKLVYQSWTDFIREHGDWLHFRADVPHALRAAPAKDSRRLTWIGTDHELALLEIQGDWMRVRVRQPAWTCVGPDQPFKGREDEGWVKWRDQKSGPWVWIFSRGC